MKITQLDKNILEIMQKDATISILDIADMLGSSKSVCWRRIQRMTEKGVIKEKVTLLDAESLGLRVVVFANVKLTSHGRKNLANFMTRIKQYPEVVECYTMMGGIDFLLKIVVRNVKEFEDFYWHQLSQIDGVQETSSHIAMTEVKLTTQLPLHNCETAD